MEILGEQLKQGQWGAGLLRVVFEVLRMHFREMFDREDESTGEKSGLVSQSLKSLATDVPGLGSITCQSVH